MRFIGAVSTILLTSIVGTDSFGQSASLSRSKSQPASSSVALTVGLPKGYEVRWLGGAGSMTNSAYSALRTTRVVATSKAIDQLWLKRISSTESDGPKGAFMALAVPKLDPKTDTLVSANPPYTALSEAVVKHVLAGNDFTRVLYVPHEFSPDNDQLIESKDILEPLGNEIRSEVSKLGQVVMTIQISRSKDILESKQPTSRPAGSNGFSRYYSATEPADRRISKSRNSEPHSDLYGSTDGDQRKQLAENIGQQIRNKLAEQQTLVNKQMEMLKKIQQRLDKQQEEMDQLIADRVEAALLDIQKKKETNKVPTRR